MIENSLTTSGTPRCMTQLMCVLYSAQIFSSWYAAESFLQRLINWLYRDKYIKETSIVCCRDFLFVDSSINSVCLVISWPVQYYLESRSDKTKQSEMLKIYVDVLIFILRIVLRSNSIYVILTSLPTLDIITTSEIVSFIAWEEKNHSETVLQANVEIDGALFPGLQKIDPFLRGVGGGLDRRNGQHSLHPSVQGGMAGRRELQAR